MTTLLTSRADKADQGSRPKMPGLSVAFILLPEFTLMAMTGFVEALRLAADEGDRSQQLHCQWTILGVDEEPVRSSAGVEVLPWERLGDPRRYDYVAVVGGLVRARPAIKPVVYEYLQRAAAAGVGLIGLCTGSFALAEAGLMRGRRCCVHWFHQEQFDQLFPEVESVSDKLFVIEDRLLTSSGGLGVIDLAVRVIEKHCGGVRAVSSLNKLSAATLFEDLKPQSRFGQYGSEQIVREKIADSCVERAVQLMEQRMSRPLSIDEIARRLGMGRRNLERAFKNAVAMSPANYSRHLRLEHAKWLLENTRRSVTQIALECGFSDASHFTRAFKAGLGYRPRDHRQSAGT